MFFIVEPKMVEFLYTIGSNYSRVQWASDEVTSACQDHKQSLINLNNAINKLPDSAQKDSESISFQTKVSDYNSNCGSRSGILTESVAMI